VLALLWHGSLPDEDEFEEFSTTMAAERDVAEDVLETARTLGAVDADPMAGAANGRLRAVGVRSRCRRRPHRRSVEPTQGSSDHGEGSDDHRRVRAVSTRDEAFVAPRENLTHAANALYMLTGEEPDEVL